MASDKRSQELRTSIAMLWTERWARATKYFDDWEAKHKCSALANYYEGLQYDPSEYPDGMDPLVFNLFYSTVESRLPLMSFQNPIAQIKPKPGRMDWEPDAAIQEANLRTDMVNTFVTDPRAHFSDTLESAIIDSQFYFGLVEVGYSADWTINPNARKPVLKTDESSEADPETPAANLIKDEQPDELPEEERVFIKHIPPKEFRVGGNDKWITEQCSWVGYREYFRNEDLESIKEFARVLELADEAASVRSDDYVPEDNVTANSETGSDLNECLIIFDLRRKVRYFISKSNGILLSEQSFDRLPLFALRFSKPAVNHGWFPIPPAKSWKAPQDEYNEVHRAQAAYRQRALPKWLANDQAFTDEAEMDKLQSSEPFTISKMQSTDPGAALVPVPYPALNAEFGRSLITSRDEFNFAAGTSLDVSPASDRETATKSKIVATRAGIRESRVLGQVGNWMAGIIREISLIQQERLTKPTWFKKTTDLEPTLGEAKTFEQAWQRIDPVSSLTPNFDFDADVDVSSLSPVAREQNKNNLLEFLAVINQYPQFAFSPKMLRYLAAMLDLRMEVVIQEMQQLAMVAQLGVAAKAKEQMQGLAGNAGAPPPGEGQGNAMSQRTVAQMQPPQAEQINNQLNNQVGLPQQ
jgi:hypothetical protein